MTKEYKILRTKRRVMFLMLSLFLAAFAMAQEGSGNWKGTQTGRQTSLFVPANSSSSNTGYGTRGYMMLPSNTNGYDPGHRFYVYVKEGETVYFSFRATANNRSFGWYYDSRSQGANNKFPDGTSGSGRQPISINGRSSTNNNLTQAETVTGPAPFRNGGYSTSGYNSKGGSFINNTGADRAFWLEFNSSRSRDNYNFEIEDWDVTVVNAAGIQQTGRVYSKYWSLINGLPDRRSTGEPNNSAFHDDFTFFVPIDNTETPQDDYFVKSINFGGSNAGYVVFFANETGPRNTGNTIEDRKSINGTSNLYHYPLFVADPDESLWPSSPLPTPILDVVFKRNEPPVEGAQGYLTIDIEYPADVDILVDLDGNGIHSGNDVIISKHFDTEGEHEIIWDGKDANGDDVPYGQEVQFISSVSFFPVHFPVYDMEQSAGMFFKNVRPGAPGAETLFWDHSGTTGNTNPGDSWTEFSGQSLVNVTGMDSPDANNRKWNRWYGTGDNGFGNNRTINTWTGASNHYMIKKVDFVYDEADLEVGKTVDREEVEFGQNVTFIVTLRNLGISWATEVEVKDQLPAGLQYVSHNIIDDNSSPYSSTYDQTTGIWSIVNGSDRFMPGDQLQLEIVATVTGEGSITNTATVDRSAEDVEPDPDLSNNTASATVTAICPTGIDQVHLSKTTLSNSNLPSVGESLFFEDFGTSDLNNGNKGRVESSFMPSNGFDFGNSYLQLPTPGGQSWDDNPIRNAARINDGFYAVVAPAYINEGWFSDDGWDSWWTPGYNEANPVYDYSGTENGAALIINAGENLTAFYERKGLIQAGAKYRASFKLFVVQGPAQVGIDILDPVTRDVLYTVQTDKYQTDYNNNHYNEWRNVEIEFTMPGSTCDAREVLISFRNHFAEIDGNDWYVDNIRLEKIEDGPTCPPVEECVTNGQTSVNLNDAFEGTVPANSELVWFTTPDHQPGTEVTDPENITESGDYYAFFYSEGYECYNTDYSTAVVEVIVIPPCVTVVAIPDVNQTPENTPVNGNVLTNDGGDGIKVTEIMIRDSNGDKITVTVPPMGSVTENVYVLDENNDWEKAGTLEIDSEGDYTFTPEDGFTGNVPMEYAIEDENGQKDNTTLNIEVIPVYNPSKNNAPIAQDDAYTTIEGEEITSNVLSNDSDPDGDTLSVIDFSQDGTPITPGGSTTVSGVAVNGDPVANAGTVTINLDGTLVFEPEDGFIGKVDPIHYTVEDGKGGNDDADIYINVLPDFGQNTTIANDDANVAPKGETLTGNVLDNDFDPEGDAQILTSVTIDGTDYPIDPNNLEEITISGKGTLTIGSDGDYEFVPEKDFVGTVVVEQKVCDDGNPEACDNATLYLTTLDVKNTRLITNPMIYQHVEHQND